MTIPKAIVCIVASAVICGVVGLGLGLLLAVVVPGYYEAMFGRDVDPVSVGIGLGVTQGTAAGLVIGCVMTIAVAWYESRVSKAQAT